ncbi:MAG: hypothetical protein ACREMA_00065 [Longimicrobiales bacterium]
MFSRCLFCHTELPENDTFEGLATGKRFAFDPVKGRLWVICSNCRRWNLIPIESRWENLEALEKIARDEARLLLQTDNIALLRVGTVELVRIGQAHLPEEAWWRYGRELTSRRARFRRLSITMGALTGAVALGGFTVGVGVVGVLGLSPVLQTIAREVKFGPVAWRGAATCPNCGSVLREIQFQNSNRVVLAQQESGFELRYRCYRCHLDALHAGYRLTGVSAEHLLRRILAYRHYEGATEAQVRASTGVIEEIGSAQQLTQRLALQRVHLGELPRPYALALEIAINHETERRLLELEVSELEARWKQEEELAAIVDNELSFLPRVLRAVPGRTAQESGH